jgi:hypothetical protein
LVALQEDCGLVVDFASFPALLLKLLNLLVEQPSTYLGLLVLRADGSAVLEFAQNLEFKAMSLLSMRVEAVPQVTSKGWTEALINASRIGKSLLPPFQPLVVALLGWCVHQWSGWLQPQLQQKVSCMPRLCAWVALSCCVLAAQ